MLLTALACSTAGAARAETCCEPCCEVADPENDKVMISLAALMAKALQDTYMQHMAAASAAAGQQFEPAPRPHEFNSPQYQEALDQQAARLLQTGITPNEAAHLEHLAQVNEEARRTIDEIRIFVQQAIAHREKCSPRLQEILQADGEAHAVQEELKRRQADTEAARQANEAASMEQAAAAAQSQEAAARRMREEASAAAAKAAKAKRDGERRKIEEESKMRVQNWLAQNGFSDVNAKRTRFFKTAYPLHVAGEKNEVLMVRLLLSGGADVTLKNGNGQTPLEYIMKKDNNGSHKEVYRVLLEATKKAKKN